MKRLLVISNLYHSTPRIPGICRHLPEHGWKATIITPRIDGEQKFRAPSSDMLEGVDMIEVGESLSYERTKARGGNGSASRAKGILRAFNSPRLASFLERQYWRLYRIRNFPDPEKGWKEYALSAAEAELETNDYDAILSSSSPVIAHIVASEVARESGIPWVAEFRDPWTDNPSTDTGLIMHLMTKQLERGTMANAKELVSVSPLWTHSLGKIHGRDAFCITNGFEPSSGHKVGGITDKFTITYTGQLYPGRRDPALFLRSIRSLIDDNVVLKGSIEARFYGPHSDHLDGLIRDLRLEGIANQYGPVTREEAVERQRESHMLLLLGWDDPKEKGVIPGKFFEYLAAGPPILLVGGKVMDTDHLMLTQTRAGWIATDEEEVKGLILSRYWDFMDHLPVVVGFRDEEKIGTYTYSNLAKKYAKLLNSMTEET